MASRVRAFDHWIRTAFRQLNTELEELYFARTDSSGETSGAGPDGLSDVGDDIKQQLVAEGKAYIVELLAEGNTDEGFDAGFDLLGNVGLYMAACRRHEITEPSRETRSPLLEASALALQLGASLGVAPRFASSHLETHNRAVDSVYKSFTTLADEMLFINYNTRGVLGYIRAAEALLRVLPLGVSHPVTYDLLRVARDAVQEVYQLNTQLFQKLDTQRFFYCVRPYYKPHRVGLHEYRGANAGDFAGINVIDLLLGLCRADDAYYSQLLVDKFLFMRPQDQLLLRDCMRRRSLLDEFLRLLDQGRAGTAVRRNIDMFLKLCDVHGATAKHHHEQLVNKFIRIPAQYDRLEDKQGLTASGPPLPVLLQALKKLSDLRAAVKRDDIPSRYADLERLRASLG